MFCPSQKGVQFNHCQGWSSGNYQFGQSTWDNFPRLDLNGGGSSDTWYPWWASDGRWYSTFTDGSVGGIHSQSGGAAPSMHGQTVLEPSQGQGWNRPGDITNMRVVQAATFAVNATPFAGNYPTGVFTSNASGQDIWYYGTYPVLGGNISKWCVTCNLAVNCLAEHYFVPGMKIVQIGALLDHFLAGCGLTIKAGTGIILGIFHKAYQCSGPMGLTVDL